MDFANECEIQDWLQRFRHQPILLSGALTLQALADAVDSCTDGWASWPAPCKSAQKLIGLLRAADRAKRDRTDFPVSEEDLRVAYRPIKAFTTKNQPKYGFALTLHYPARQAAPQPEPALSLF